MGALLQSALSPWLIVALASISLLLSISLKKFAVVVLLIALIFGASLISLRQYSISNSYLRSHIGHTQTITARVRTDPVASNSKVTGNSFAARRFSFLASTAFGPVRVMAPKNSAYGLLPGQKISLTGRIVRSKEPRVAALIITSSTIKRITSPSRWARSLAAIRDGLRSVSGGGDAGALIPGMVIGDTALQSDQFKDQMRRAGLTHLVAVSGANFAIVSAFVLWCMQFLFRKVHWRLTATAISLVAFIALVRPSPSVLRAAAMAAVALIAMGSKQRSDSLPALGFAIIAVVSIDPWQSRDPGFALSVLATAGLLLFSQPIASKISRWLPEKVAAACAPPIAAMAFCLPIIVALSGYISPLSIVANIVAAPFVAPITVVGFVAALISPISPWLAHLLILAIRPFAAVITEIAQWASRYPVLTLKSGAIGALIALTIIAILFIFRTKGALALLLLIALSLWLTRFPTTSWQFYMCDVGQGDATVINLHDHKAIVIDVGPDPQLIDRCLRQLDIRTISLLILTHPHADHVGGISGATKGRKVEAEWFGNVAAGTHATIGEYSIDVLWPTTVGADDENPNNVSIAAVIRSKDLSLFASGDIEPQVQEKLRGRVGHVDIYKVAHHGSRYQDPALMREISPTIALISAGEGNSYGHPAESTIADLRALHARVLRTDRVGAIAVEMHRHRATIESENSWPRWLGFY